MDSRRVFLGFCGALLLFQIVHLATVPILVTYDGYEYLRYARLLGTPQFESEYYFSRPPLYPALLRLSMAAFGFNPFAVQLPGLLLGFAGQLLLALLLRKLNHPRLAILAVGLAAIAPEFLVYQHTPLTEIGSFFFLALIVFAVLYPTQPNWIGAGLLALALGTSYYHRPTLIYLAPLCALLWLMRLRLVSNSDNWSKCLLQAALILILPFLIALPWSQKISSKPVFKNMSRHMIGFGMLKGVLLPPDDPLMANVRPAYIKAIADSTTEGVLDAAGLTQASFVQFQWDFMLAHAEDADRVFLQSIIKYPQRYLTGVTRCLVYFMGRDSLDDDNQQSARAIFDRAAVGSVLQGQDHPNFSKEEASLKRDSGRSVVAKVWNKLITPYRWLLILGSVVTLLGFARALHRRDLVLLVLTALPLYFLLFHALLLLSVNRFVFPLQPFFLINLLLVPARWYSPKESSSRSPHQTRPRRW